MSSYSVLLSRLKSLLVDGRQDRTWSISTTKFHALGDVVDSIRRCGTTDSYSTQLVSLSLLNIVSTFSNPILRSLSAFIGSQNLDTAEQTKKTFSLSYLPYRHVKLDSKKFESKLSPPRRNFTDPLLCLKPTPNTPGISLASLRTSHSTSDTCSGPTQTTWRLR